MSKNDKNLPPPLPLPGLEGLPPGLGAVALGSIEAPAAIFDRDFRIVWMNESMAFVQNCDLKASLGQPCRDHLTCCPSDCDHCRLKPVLETGQAEVIESWVDLPVLGRRWGDLHLYPIRDAGGEVISILAIAFDTTKHVLEKEAREGEPPHDNPAALTPRETEVLRLITQGLTNAQISDKLDISAHTVKSYVISIFNKLGVNDRTMAAVQAVRRHMV